MRRRIWKLSFIFSVLTVSFLPAQQAHAQGPAAYVPMLAYLGKTGYEAWSTWQAVQFREATLQAFQAANSLVCSPENTACADMLKSGVENAIQTLPGPTLPFIIFQGVMAGTDFLTVIFICPGWMGGIVSAQVLNFLSGTSSLFATLLVLGGSTIPNIFETLPNLVNQGHVTNVTLPYVQLYELEGVGQRVQTEAHKTLIVGVLAVVISGMSIYLLALV